jgi:hypothetical protein
VGNTTMSFEEFKLQMVRHQGLAEGLAKGFEQSFLYLNRKILNLKSQKMLNENKYTLFQNNSLVDPLQLSKPEEEDEFVQPSKAHLLLQIQQDSGKLIQTENQIFF